jgi:NAD(P)-dependent dehydrogenase (short-subunit alcohol dehydrogenase family)
VTTEPGQRISLDGRVALVTGAGRGIGRAHALALASRGARVVVNDLDPDVSEAVVAEIVAAGGKAAAAAGSVADPDTCLGIATAAFDHYGKVDILINNAGILRTGYFEEIDQARYNAVLDTHLRGSYLLTQAVWPAMKQAGYGRVLMTGSSSAMWSHQGLSNYAAAKGGIWGITKALAYEGAPHGIRTNLLMPYASTPIGVENPIPDMQANRRLFLDDAAQERLIARWQPEFVAHMAVYLASDACEVNGEAFSVCGGRYARVFVGVADGWMAPGLDTLTTEDVVANLPTIRDVSHHSIPTWLFDECVTVAKELEAYVTPELATPTQ